jgi:hypothetical protein
MMITTTLYASRAEAAGSTLCFVEFFAYVPDGLYHRCDDHLGNSVTTIDDKIGLAVIDQIDADFAAIIGVDRSGRIYAGNTVFCSETGPGANLGFKTNRQGDGYTDWDQVPCAGT